MGVNLSNRDHRELRSFIRNAKSKLARVGAADPRDARQSQLRDDVQFAIPVDDIDPATVAGTTWTPTFGEAHFVNYVTSSGRQFSKFGDHRGKLEIANIHRGMWVWSDVLIRVIRDFRSGVFVVDNLSGSHIVRGVAAASIAAGATNGSVNVFRGVTLERVVTNVRHDWMHAGTAIASGTQLLIKWFDEDICWRVIEAACP